MKRKIGEALLSISGLVIILIFWIIGGLAAFIATPIFLVGIIGSIIFGVGWFIYHFLTGFSHISVDTRDELKIGFFVIFLMSLTIECWTRLIQLYGHPVLTLFIIILGWAFLFNWFKIDIKK